MELFAFLFVVFIMFWLGYRLGTQDEIRRNLKNEHINEMGNGNRQSGLFVVYSQNGSKKKAKGD